MQGPSEKVDIVFAPLSSHPLSKNVFLLEQQVHFTGYKRFNDTVVDALKKHWSK